MILICSFITSSGLGLFINLRSYARKREFLTAPYYCCCCVGCYYCYYLVFSHLMFLMTITTTHPLYNTPTPPPHKSSSTHSTPPTVYNFPPTKTISPLPTTPHSPSPSCTFSSFITIL